MSKTEVSLAFRDWVLIKETLGQSGASAVADQAMRFKLYCRLSNRLDAAEATVDEQVSIPLTAAQMRTLVDVLNRPPTPWRISATEYVWGLKKALGWQPGPDEGTEIEEDEE